MILSALGTSLILEAVRQCYASKSLALLSAGDVVMPTPTPPGEPFSPTPRPPRGFACTTLFNRNYTIPIPADDQLSGSLALASCCDVVSADWSWGSLWYYSDQITRFYTTSTKIGKHTKEFLGGSCVGPFTTLADGVPRALCAPSPSPTITMDFGDEWIDVKSMTASPSITPYPFKKPDCEIDESACSRLWDNYWNSRTSSFRESVSYDLGQLTSAISVTIVHPSCNDLTMRACYDECLFNLDLSILFWPTVGRNGSEVEPSQSPKPRTILWGSHILTYPTVYASYSTMTHGLGCGGSHTGILVPLDPASIFVINGNPLPDQTSRTALSPVNFANFEYSTMGTQSYPLVPYSDYQKQYKCSGRANECSTIYHDYGPEIVFRIDPEVLRGIDPEWKRCGNELHTAYDPPIALQAVGSVVAPRLTVHASASPTVVVSVSAMPKPTPLIESPTRTGRVTIFATKAPRVDRPTPAFLVDPGAPRIEDQRQTRQAEFVVNGGKTITATQRPNGAFMIDGKTMPREKEFTKEGVKISAFSSGIVVDYGNTGLKETGSSRTQKWERSEAGKGWSSASVGARVEGWRILVLSAFVLFLWWR
jgi:hypothetical protein